jgi:hypothetical protein
MFGNNLPQLLRVSSLLTLSMVLVACGPHMGSSQPPQPEVNICNAPTGLNDPGSAQSQPYLFAWKLFLTINCPASNDPAAPRVWETWKPVDAVYLSGGRTPDPWGAPLPPRTLLDRNEIDGYRLLDNKGRPVLSEIRMNQATFDYIVSGKLYNRAGQLAFFNSASEALSFPAGAMEIKAAWLILDPNDPKNSTYYTIHASYMDQTTKEVHQVLAGLASLHITSKVLPHWFWTTFEHVDNQKMTKAPEDVPIPPDVRAVNDEVHAAIPQSVWSFYNLRGVQLDYTNGDHTPTILANTLLETRFQPSSSCITCHNLATRGDLGQGRLGFLNMLPNGGVQGHVGQVGDKSNVYVDSSHPPRPVCYDSVRDVFTDCNPSNPKIVYKTMDFVWSLKEAQ